MDNTTLLSIIKSHRRDSLGYESGDLSQERARAMDHYHGRPYGNEIDGRSKIVSRDLAETVDWALPAIMRVFVQSGNLAEFSPVGPQDEALAQQETDYTNQVIMKDNPGFMILHDAIKDTLLLKNGYVKHWWQEEEKIEEDELYGMTMEQIVKLDADMRAEGGELVIKGQKSRIEAIPGMGPQQPAQQIMANPAAPAMAGQIELFDLEVQYKRKVCGVKIEAVPSEEVRVSKKCRGSLQDSPFTEHVTLKTRSDLVEMGMPRAFVDKLPAYKQDDNSSERLARDSVLDENTTGAVSSVSDRSMDEIEFCEAYIRVDYDGDGIAELRKVVTVAGKIPPGEDWNEAIPAVALTGFVMKRVPHRHIGESLDDGISDIQEIKTALERQLLDNIYLTNNQRVFINERVNTRDLLSSTPGGAIRVRGEGPVGDSAEPFVTQPILDKILPAIDYWDKTKETRSGIRPGSDMDPDMLREVTKGAFLEGMNRLSQKIEMIARMLAESGVKDMVLQVHDLLIRHQDKPRMVQMRGKWVEVDPRTWKSRTDLSLKVGLGTGNEEEKRQKISMLAQHQMQVLQAATQAPAPVYSRMYALFEDNAKAMGFDVPDKYAIPPNSPEYQQLQQQMQQNQQQNPQMAKVQADAQAEQARLQQEGALRQAEMRMQAQVDAHRQQVEAQQQQARMTMELQLERQRNAMDMQLAREKAQMQAQIDVLLARIKAEAQIDAAQVAASSTLTTQQETASDNAVGDAQ
jgi:hypothetical protein